MRHVCRAVRIGIANRIYARNLCQQTLFLVHDELTIFHLDAQLLPKIGGLRAGEARKEHRSLDRLARGKLNLEMVMVGDGGKAGVSSRFDPTVKPCDARDGAVIDLDLVDPEIYLPAGAGLLRLGADLGRVGAVDEGDQVGVQGDYLAETIRGSCRARRGIREADRPIRGHRTMDTSRCPFPMPPQRPGWRGRISCIPVPSTIFLALTFLTACAEVCCDGEERVVAALPLFLLNLGDCSVYHRDRVIMRQLLAGGVAIVGRGDALEASAGNHSVSPIHDYMSAGSGGILPSKPRTSCTCPGWAVSVFARVDEKHASSLERDRSAQIDRMGRRRL